jgi:diguanylate cyclase (GGDEF)-like protein/PAS domain S-box-containing protein
VDPVDRVVTSPVEGGTTRPPPPTPGAGWQRPGGLALPYALPVAAAMLLFWLTFASLWTLGTRNQDELRAARVGSWYVSQLIQGAFEVLVASQQLFAASPEREAALRDDLQEKLDVLWSRVPLLGAAEPGPLFRQALPVEALQATLREHLQRLDEVVPTMTRQDHVARDLIAAEIGALLPKLKQASMRLYLERLGLLGELQEYHRAADLRLLIEFIGMFASVIVLIGLLMHRTLRLQRLLAATDSARADADRARRDLAAVLDSVPVMIAAIDAEGRCAFANRRLLAFHRADERSIVGTPFEQLEPDGRVVAATRAVLATGMPEPLLEHRATDPASGETRVLLTTTTPVPGVDGRIERVVRTSLDITERRRAEEKIRHLALHDALTGLPNRAFFRDCLSAAVAAAAQLGEPFALHLIDLDRFKEINDTLGHHVGDAILVAATRRMQSVLREGDMLGRLGGDEFALIQRGAVDDDSARAGARRLVQSLLEPFRIAGHEIALTSSVGYALSFDADPSEPLDTLLRSADLALYAAKAAGRNQVCRYDVAMNAALVERKALEQDLRRAIEAGGLELYLQPIVALADQRLVAAEALVRWPHPERGLIYPDRFIPLAEETGLIIPLSDWVIDAACRTARRWRERLGRTVPIAVNVSPVQLAQGTLERTIEESLARSGAAAEFLQIEVTERLLIENADSALGVLQRLRARGIVVALDDFGTGYASLGYLQRFPFDKLKIDRSFVAGLGRPGTAADRIIDAVVSLAHGLNLRVLGEGVECRAQAERLRELGCDEAQGYFYGRAMRAEELEARLVGDRPWRRIGAEGSPAQGARAAAG